MKSVHGSWILAAAAVLASTTTVHAATPPSTPSAEARVRELYHLPANAKLRYLADDGSPLTFEAFSARISAVPYDVKTDKATGVTTFQFMEIGGAREIGAVKKLPPLDATTVKGVRVRNADLAGKLTFVSFYFSTCAPCLRELPVMNAFMEKHRDVNLLAITPDSGEETRQFVNDRGFHWPAILPGAQDLIAQLQVKAYPTWLLVSKDGRILGRGTGIGDEMKDPDQGLRALEAWIAARRQ